VNFQAPRPKMNKKQGPWNRIPQLINALRFYLMPKAEDTLEYDPFHLKIFTNRQYVKYGEKFYVESLRQDRNLGRRLSTNDMDLDAFKYVLAQVPAVRTVEFAGRGEPLLNKDIFKMIRMVTEYNDAYTTMTTTGLLLDRFAELILESPLKQLVIRMYGHRPAIYHAMSGLEARNFPVIVKNLRDFIARRNQSQSRLDVVLQMATDVHHYREVPDMLAFAREIGADALWVDNYLSPAGDEPSERTLYDDYGPVKEFFAAVMAGFAKEESGRKNPHEGFNLKLPVMLPRNMTHNRNCHDPYTTLAVDGDCNVLPCSRQMIYEMPPGVVAQLGVEVIDPDKAGKIWHEDFWNNPMYQWMRLVHSPDEEGKRYDVPLPCQHCPKNAGN